MMDAAGGTILAQGTPIAPKLRIAGILGDYYTAS